MSTIVAPGWCGSESTQANVRWSQPNPMSRRVVPAWCQPESDWADVHRGRCRAESARANVGLGRSRPGLCGVCRVNVVHNRLDHCRAESTRVDVDRSRSRQMLIEIGLGRCRAELPRAKVDYALGPCRIKLTQVESI